MERQDQVEGKFGMELAQVTLIGDAFDHSEAVAYFDGCWYAGGEGGQIWRIDSEGAIV